MHWRRSTPPSSFPGSKLYGGSRASSLPGSSRSSATGATPTPSTRRQRPGRLRRRRPRPARGPVMDADPKAYPDPLPRRSPARREDDIPLFEAELGKTVSAGRNDRPLDGSWTKPDAATVARIEAAGGLVDGAVRRLPDDCRSTSSRRPPRRSGRRATARSGFRPYADGPITRVAAVWTRDGRNWRLASGTRPTRSASRTQRTGWRSSSPSTSPAT